MNEKSWQELDRLSRKMEAIQSIVIAVTVALDNACRPYDPQELTPAMGHLVDEIFEAGEILRNISGAAARK